MRWDTIAQILSFSEIHSSARVLVIESLIGLLTGSVAYRLRGQGAIASVFCGQQPHLEMVEWLNLSEEDASIIKSIPSSKLGSNADYVGGHGFVTGTGPSDETEIPKDMGDQVLSPEESGREKAALETKDESAGPAHMKAYKRLAKTSLELAQEDHFLRSGFDRYINNLHH